MILYTLLFTPQVNNYFALTSLHMGTNTNFFNVTYETLLLSTDGTVHGFINPEHFPKSLSLSRLQNITRFTIRHGDNDDYTTTTTYY